MRIQKDILLKSIRIRNRNKNKKEMCSGSNRFALFKFGFIPILIALAGTITYLKKSGLVGCYGKMH